MLDLHVHSTASDGSMSPSKIVSLAKKIKLRALAITDHDTVEGIDEAKKAAKDEDVCLLPGVELSAKSTSGTIHIVGLDILHKEKALTQTLDRVQTMRNERNPRIADALLKLGKPVSMEEVRAIAGGGVIGRPHFAQAMIAKGYVKDVNAAFKKYLGIGGAAEVPKERLAPRECIEAIRKAGGVPILAHPDQTRKKGAQLDELVKELVEYGLAGIEVFCCAYNTQMTHDYSKLAKKYDLVRSGGTDFHGKSKPKIKLGRGLGSLHIHDSLLEPIREVAQKIRRER